jgi:hypothetical protein
MCGCARVAWCCNNGENSSFIRFFSKNTGLLDVKVKQNRDGRQREQTAMGIARDAVLIVEHDPVVRSLYTRTFATDSEVIVAHTVEQLIALVTHPTLRAVVIEPHRPDGLGSAMLGVIAGHMGGRDVPVLVCSVLDAQYLPRYAGKAHYLVKPIAPDTLREFIRTPRFPVSERVQGSGAQDF